MSLFVQTKLFLLSLCAALSQVERGWDEQVFTRIKQVFGYGA